MPMKVQDHRPIETISTCYWFPDISLDESSEAFRVLTDGKRYHFLTEGTIKVLADFDTERKKYKITNLQAEKNFGIKEGTMVINQDGSLLALPKNFKTEDRIQVLEKFFRGDPGLTYGEEDINRSEATEELVQKATDISRNIDKNLLSQTQNQTIDQNNLFGIPYGSSTPSAIKPIIGNFIHPKNKVDFFLGKKLAPNENQLVGLSEGFMRAGTLTPSGTIKTSKHKQSIPNMQTEIEPVGYKSSITILDQQTKNTRGKLNTKEFLELEEERESIDSLIDTPIKEDTQTAVRFNLPAPKPKREVFQREPPPFVNLRPRKRNNFTRIRTANLGAGDYDQIQNFEPAESAFNMRQVKLNDSQLDTENFIVNPPKNGEDWLEFILRVEQDLEAHILYLQTSVGDEDFGDGFDVKSVIRRMAFFIRNFNLLKSQTGKLGKSVQIIGASASSVSEMIQAIFENFEDKNNLLSRMENELFDRDTQSITIFLAKLAHRLKFIFGAVERSMFDRLCFKAFRFDESLADFYKTRFFYRTGSSFDLKKTTESISDFLATDIYTGKNSSKKKTHQMSHRMTQNDSQVHEQIDLLSDCVATLAREANHNDSVSKNLIDLQRSLSEIKSNQTNLTNQVIQLQNGDRRPTRNYQVQAKNAQSYQESARAAVLNSTNEIKNQLQSFQSNNGSTSSQQNGLGRPSYDIPYVELRRRRNYQKSVVSKHKEFFERIMKLHNGRLNHENLPNYVCKLCYHDHLTKQHAPGAKFAKFYPDGYRNDKSDDADLDEFGKNIPLILEELSKN